MIRTFDDYEHLSQAAAEFVVDAGRVAVARAGRFDLVLAGGSTPQRTHALLADALRSDADLSAATHFYFGDERCVPPDSAESNYHSARVHLFDAIDLGPDRVHRIPAEQVDRHAVARTYGQTFPAAPDLLMLGMGDDGHTASLFPGSSALDEQVERFQPTVAPTQPVNRISATPVVLQAARQTLVLVWGMNKAPALRRVFAVEGDVCRTPARLVREAVWFVDADAAQAAGLDAKFNPLK